MKADFVIRRQITVDEWTHGELLIDGVRFCYTLEDPIREILVADGEWRWESRLKVPKQTAIPSGIYPLAVTWSPRFKRDLPLIDRVPDFVGIRIHSGRTADHSEGCPLIGRQRDTTAGRLWDADGLTDELIGAIRSFQRLRPCFVEVRNP